MDAKHHKRVFAVSENGKMKIKEYIILLDEDGLFLHIEDELIRCEDCRYRDKCHREIALKEYDEDFDANYVSFQKLTFCSYGERREK